VLVIKNVELKQSNEQSEEQNKKLTREKENLAAFRNIILILLAVAAVAYVGTVLISEAA
jgi:CHASE3 domain sensor protein